MAEAPIDAATVEYFDSLVPEYGTDRLAVVARFSNAHQIPDASLIDVGAGTGNTLKFIENETGIGRLAAFDVSRRCLDQVKEHLDCELLQGSILDTEFIEKIGPRFDFVVVAAVLHHLIGRSRRQSHEYAALAVVNAKRLLKPGGYLIIS